MAEMPQNIASQIRQVLEARSAKAKRVEKHLELLKNLERQIVDTDTIVENIQADSTFPEEVREKFKKFGSSLGDALNQLIKDFEIFLRRLSRGTINICVTGQARVGKSTFLQSVSGLSDKEIPTGSGIPVTAVRSWILHNPARAVAVVTFHTFESFRDTILQPYHTVLDLPFTPATLEDFRSYPYPEPSAIDREEHTKITLLVRLREMQKFLPTYEHLFDKAPAEIPLDDLRQYVAYPPSGDESSPRLHLAVKEVRVECPFPLADVEGLGLIDLPGLGELAPAAEERHLEGLRNEVDFVLWLKRPVEGLGYWSQSDGNLANLLDRARGSISSRRDFVWIVVNTGGVSDHQIESLERDILEKANEGVKDKHFRVCRADVKNPQEIFENVMSPVLEHLGERLPVMDEQLAASLYRRSEQLAKQIKEHCKLLDTECKDLRARYYVPSETERLDEMAKTLREEIARDLQELIDDVAGEQEGEGGRLRRFAEDYKAALEECGRRLNEWIEQGFGVGKEEWIAGARRRLRVDLYPDKVIVDGINHIRTALARELFTLDEVFKRHLREIWEAVGEVFAKRLGSLLPPDGVGETRLRTLQHCLEEAAEPCPTLAKAVRQLLEVQVEFRTLIYPEVWDQIRTLFHRFKAEAQAAIEGEDHSSVAEILFDFFQSAGRKTVYESIKILLETADRPQLVYATILGVFEDQFIRSEESEKEFKRLVRSYRDSVFPKEFSGFNPNSVILQRLRERVKVANELAETLDSESRA